MIPDKFVHRLELPARKEGEAERCATCASYLQGGEAKRGEVKTGHGSESFMDWRVCM
jgi:hypothetical protein